MLPDCAEPNMDAPDAPIRSRSDFQRLAELFKQALEQSEGRNATPGSVSPVAPMQAYTRTSAVFWRPMPAFMTAPAPPLRGCRDSVSTRPELIGTGGMGTVYRATREDGEVCQAVAVKAGGLRALVPRR